MIRLIAFLGNPGPEYSRNRHNAGRMLAETLPFYAALDWQRKYQGRYAALSDPRFLAEKVHFLMPETYMNRSGESICAAAAFFKIKTGEIMLVHDELELPLGTISLKFAGGLGGHNGLRSMKACVGSADCWRLRIGIGRPGDREPGAGGPPGSDRGVVDWVLSDFSAEETERLGPALEAGKALLSLALAQEPETLLPEWAKKKIITA